MAARLRRWLSALVVITAIAYPAALLLTWLLLRFVGESWWVTGILLYLPPIGFGLPLLVLVPALALSRQKRLLLLQVLSLVLVVVPLMGLTVSWPFTGSSEKKLRIVSYNVNSGYGGFRLIADEILSYSPDIFFGQELPDWRAPELVEMLKASYPHMKWTGEFFVASKFPIVAEVTPERVPFFGEQRSPRFMKVVIDSPLGKLTFFHVHTLSPRGAFYSIRGMGLRREILSGRLMQGAHSESLQVHSALRALQVEAMAKQAAAETGPVMIVGDTNLPALSPVRHRYLSAFQDGFAQVGQGFGATFPAKFPWMRIDLLLASSQLRFSSFDVGKQKYSDHRCIVADVRLASP